MSVLKAGLNSILRMVGKLVKWETMITKEPKDTFFSLSNDEMKVLISLPRNTALSTRQQLLLFGAALTAMGEAMAKSSATCRYYDDSAE